MPPKNPVILTEIAAKPYKAKAIHFKFELSEFVFLIKNRSTVVARRVQRVIHANNSCVSFTSPAAPVISEVKKAPVPNAKKAESVPTI